jgi:N-methylhydantoinase A/oxoprolinase/acetone carboxylase beta subunit
VSEACYLGTDVGGTFTDLVFYTGSGELLCFKVPSTPARPGASILEGIDDRRWRSTIWHGAIWCTPTAARSRPTR